MRCSSEGSIDDTWSLNNDTQTWDLPSTDRRVLDQRNPRASLSNIRTPSLRIAPPCIAEAVCYFCTIASPRRLVRSLPLEISARPSPRLLRMLLRPPPAAARRPVSSPILDALTRRLRNPVPPAHLALSTSCPLRNPRLAPSPSIAKLLRAIAP